MAQIAYVNWDGLVYYDTKVKDYIKDKLEECVKFHGEAKRDQLPDPSYETLNFMYVLAEDIVADEDFRHPGEIYYKGTIVQVIDYNNVYLYDSIYKNTSLDIDLSDYYTKTEIDSQLSSLSNIIDNLNSTLVSVQEQSAKNEVKLLAIDSELFDITKKLETIPTKVSELDNDLGFINQIPPEYVTEDELSAALEEIEHPVVDLDGYATEEYVLEKIAEAEIADKEIDLSMFYTKSEVDAKIPSLEGLATEDYVQNAIDSIEIPQQDLSQYALKTEIPTKVSSLENDLDFTTKKYVDDAIKNIDIPEIDTSNLATKEELNLKSNKVLFTEDKLVTNALGAFKVNDSLKGLTIEEIILKLLCTASTPDDPEPVDNLAARLLRDKVPMYSVNQDHILAEVPFVELDANAEPDVSGFYVRYDADGNLTAAGYQDLTIYNDELYYMIALPKEMVYNNECETWDADEKIWVRSEFPLSSNEALVEAACNEAGIDISNIDKDKYTIWVADDICTGSIIRYRIEMEV